MAPFFFSSFISVSEERTYCVQLGNAVVSDFNKFAFTCYLQISIISTTSDIKVRDTQGLHKVLPQISGYINSLWQTLIVQCFIFGKYILIIPIYLSNIRKNGVSSRQGKHWLLLKAQESADLFFLQQSEVKKTESHLVANSIIKKDSQRCRSETQILETRERVRPTSFQTWRLIASP